MNIGDDVEKLEASGAELRAIHDELLAEGVPLAEIVLSTDCSTSTLYKIYRGEKNVKPKYKRGALRGLTGLMEKIKVSA